MPQNARLLNLRSWQLQGFAESLAAVSPSSPPTFGRRSLSHAPPRCARLGRGGQTPDMAIRIIRVIRG
ncbi:MAG: hypothetical protein Kow00120_10990 [Anaerolineae bacterium]